MCKGSYCKISTRQGVVLAVLGEDAEDEGGGDGYNTTTAGAAAGNKPVSANSKGHKRDKGKKKKAQLEPGMAEAQSYASHCLRLMSLCDDLHAALLSAGIVRYMMPLLDGQVAVARWNARQVCCS